MKRLVATIVLGGIFLSFPLDAHAGNSDEVNAGVDVTLTGGAVVANVTTGASLWYNPAGLARLPDKSFEVTGVTFKTSIIRYPGLLTLETGEESKGRTTNLSLTPEAITFTLDLKRTMMGLGIFNSSLRRELVQEDAMSSTGVSPEVIARGAVNARTDFVHVSTGFASKFDKRKHKVLVGGAFDFIVGTNRVDSILSATYDGGAEGAVSDSLLENEAGFGLQLRFGIQWVPIPQVRVGFSISTPSYMFLLFERQVSSVISAPPNDSSQPNVAETVSTKRRRGGWFGAEPGTMRTGLVYIGDWGWIEGDLVVDFRLRSERFLFANRTVANGRVATVLDVTTHFKLGIGAFTDVTKTDELINYGDSQIDFFGVNLGLLFSTQDFRPDAEPVENDGKPPIALAIGIRYSHGRGDTLGVLIPATYTAGGAEFRRVATKINDIDINFGVKVLF
jgi:hypothetical protein